MANLFQESSVSSNPSTQALSTSSKPERRWIKDLEPAQFLDGAFSVQNCQLGQTKTGKPFIKCLLADKTGRTPGRMWNATEELFADLPTDGFVWVSGQTQPYQGEMQIIIQNIHPYEPADAELAELLPSTKHDIDQMFAEVIRLLGTIEHPAMANLVHQYLGDGELMNKFCQAPAASALHHAYLGGLLEHTLSLLRLADATVGLYPELNRDIVLMGLFLHDLGKCLELSWTNGFGYTDDGQLVGHIARGSIILHDKAKAAAEDPEGPGAMPEPIMQVLHHIILSHHGQPEFGALKIPSTPEAIFISNLDNLDAKMNLAIDGARGEAANKAQEAGNGNFTEKIWALETRLYRPDPTKVDQG